MLYTTLVIFVAIVLNIGSTLAAPVIRGFNEQRNGELFARTDTPGLPPRPPRPPRPPARQPPPDSDPPISEDKKAQLDYVSGVSHAAHALYLSHGKAALEAQKPDPSPHSLPAETKIQLAHEAAVARSSAFQQHTINQGNADSWRMPRVVTPEVQQHVGDLAAFHVAATSNLHISTASHSVVPVSAMRSGEGSGARPPPAGQSSDPAQAVTAMDDSDSDAEPPRRPGQPSFTVPPPRYARGGRSG